MNKKQKDALAQLMRTFNEVFLEEMQEEKMRRMKKEKIEKMIAKMKEKEKHS